MDSKSIIKTNNDSVIHPNVAIVKKKNCYDQYEEPIKAIGCLKDIHNKTDSIASTITVNRALITTKLFENDEYVLIKNEFTRLDEKYGRVIKHYLENPALIEPFLADIIKELVDLISNEISMLLIEQYFGYLFYIYTTIRIKGFIRCYGQDVNHITKVIKLLEKFQQNQLFTDGNINAQNPPQTEDCNDIKLTVLFGIVLLVVSCISIPFDLHQIHGKICVWIENIIKNIAINPMKYGICSDLFPLLFSRYLHRADVDQNCRIQMIKWCVGLVNQSQLINSTLQPQILLLCLASYFKNGDRTSDIDKALYTFKNINLEYFMSKKSVQIKVAIYKLLQRIGIIFLKPCITNWKNRKTHIRILAGNDNSNTLTNFNNNNNINDCANIEIPIEVEYIIEKLLCGLGSENFKSRLSAAKGIGKVCERLDMLSVDDIVVTIGSMIDTYNPSEYCQGACLVFGELARRGFISTKQLPQIVEKIKLALLYEDRYITVNHGTFVRDAACYVCWTFSRAFSPNEFKPFAATLVGDILCVALFDNELICRRAASAVLQELVGRMGNISHGIYLVTLCDYTNVKSLEYCYLTLAPKLYKLECYQQSILDHLMNYRLCHWEMRTRVLSSSALSNIAKDSPSIFVNGILESIFETLISSNKLNYNQFHGFLFAYSNILYVIHREMEENKLRSQLHQIFDKVDEIIIDCRPMIQQIIRTAVIHFYTKLQIFQSIYPNIFTKEYYERLFKDIHTGILSTNIDLNNECLLFFKFYRMNFDPKSISNIYMDDYLINTLFPLVNTTKKRLYSLCKIMKYISPTIANTYFEKLYGYFIQLYRMDRKTINEDTDNIHVKALSTKLIYTLIKNVSSNKITSSICEDFLTMLIMATQDYTINTQGDVGLNVRLMAVKYIPKTIACLVNSPFYFNIKKELLEKLICAILRQSAERVQKLRSTARNAFVKIFECEDYRINKQLSVIDNYDEISKLLREEKTSNWCVDSNAFIINYHVLQYQTYACSSFLGILAFLTSSGLVNLENQTIKNIFHHLETISNCPDSIDNICNAIVYIINNYGTHQRTRDSLIACIEPLISYNILKKVHTNDRDKLAHLLLNFLSSSAQIIISVSKLKQIIDCFISLTDITDSNHFQYDCVVQVSKLICHRFPTVRVYAVQKMFTYLSVVGPLENWTNDTMDKLLSILLDTQWEQDLSLIQTQLDAIHQLMLL